MNPEGEPRLLFDVFESSGIGLIGFDADLRIRGLNRSAGLYLDCDPAELPGREARVLASGIRSREFWEAFPSTFYCLAPGPRSLLLTVSRGITEDYGCGLRRALTLRPYSLEREFARMRACLNNCLAQEIGSHLSAIGIASEFIVEPELRESRQTREAFLSTFRHDVTDLNDLFIQLLETAEPLSLPNRANRVPLDWNALLADLARKVRGLAGEKSVTLSCSPAHGGPSPAGDYHWLYLALFGLLTHALRAAAPLSEVRLESARRSGRVTTGISWFAGEARAAEPWPPPALFPLPEQSPRIGQMGITELAVSRSIVLLHGGDVTREERDARLGFTIELPA